MMARELFVDASAWIALVNENDRQHSRASVAFPRFLLSYSRLVTTNLVIAEAYISLRRQVGFGAAFGFLSRIDGSPRIERVRFTQELEAEAEAILRQYADQDFSYTDAVSFAVMRQRGIQEAFTFDQHFAAAGFAMVPGAQV